MEEFGPEFADLAVACPNRAEFLKFITAIYIHGWQVFSTFCAHPDHHDKNNQNGDTSGCSPCLQRYFPDL